ncbi:MAG: hypothetical protein ACOX5X_02960 [Acholeplasmataceae bacterium]|jgi:hypothetical protein
MKKFLSLLLILIFLPLVASCDEKKEMEEIKLADASTMVNKARNNTEDVSVISFEAPIDVTFTQTVEFQGETNETKNTVVGNIKGFLDVDNIIGHISLELNYTTEMVKLGMTTSGNAKGNIYIDNKFVYLDITQSDGKTSTTIKNKIKHQFSANMISDGVNKGIDELDLTQGLVLDSDNFKMFKVGRKFEFVREYNLTEELSKLDTLEMPQIPVDFLTLLEGFVLSDDSVVKLGVTFGKQLEEFNLEAKVKGTSEETVFGVSMSSSVDIEASFNLNLKAKAEKIDFTEFADYVEITTDDLQTLLGGLSGLLPNIPF